MDSIGSAKTVSFFCVSVRDFPWIMSGLVWISLAVQKLLASSVCDCYGPFMNYVWYVGLSMGHVLFDKLNKNCQTYYRGEGSLLLANAF